MNADSDGALPLLPSGCDFFTNYPMRRDRRSIIVNLVSDRFVTV